ncbi:MAG: VWA domain-containing protein, partial [Clostridia bacterium]|nr:VWA domain-containing protein [Clostridia bacterium]
MPNMRDTEEVARRVLPLIYVIDTSGSMYGERIAKVNQAMLEMPRVMKDVSDSNPDAETKIGVLQFSTGAKWVTPGLVSMDDFYWNKMEAGGTTMFAEMLNELHAKLSRSEYMKSDTGCALPVLIFMSDGEPTDANGVWEKKLDWVTQNNKWFQ